MKKRAAILMSMALLMGSVLSGCASGAGAGEAAEPIVLKWGISDAAEDPLTLTAKAIAEEITEKTDGRVTVQLFPNNELGSLADLAEQVQRGSNIMTLASADFFGDYAPDLAITNGPYIYSQDWINELGKIVSSDWYEEQKDLLRDYNIETLAIGLTAGERHLITANVPVNTPADLAGLKMRTAGGLMTIEMFKAFGASPITIPLAELYQSLQQGIVDGAEGDLATLYNGAYYEVADYIIMNGHNVACNMIVMSADTYSKITDADKAVMENAITANIDAFLAQVESRTADYKAKLTEEGVEFIEVDRAVFAEAASGAYGNITQFSPGLYEKIKAIVEE